MHVLDDNLKTFSPVSIHHREGGTEYGIMAVLSSSSSAPEVEPDPDPDPEPDPEEME